MRRWPEHLLALVGSLLVGCHVHPQAAPGSQQLEAGELVSAGRQRRFVFYRPEGPGPFPLVVALHGRLGDGPGMDRLSSLSKLAASEHFAVVFPDGYDKSWNDVRHVGPAAEAQYDDVRFLAELIAHFVNQQGADPARVYAVGMSNGGFMAQTLACALGPTLAAVGTVTAGVTDGMVATCRPTAAVPMMLVLGTEDPLVPWDGGHVAKDRGTVLPGTQSAAWWAQTDGCPPTPARTELPDVDPADGTRVVRWNYPGCRDGAQVLLYEVQGGGHTWPKGWKYLGEWAVGRVSQDFDATTELWRFLKAHHR